MRNVIYTFCLLALAACSGSPENNIVNRWTLAGVLSRNHGPYERSAGRMPDEMQEYEFLEGGKFNLYEKGVIEGSGTYTLAGDGKSLFLQDGAGRGIGMEILQLTGSELRLSGTSGFSKGDTMVLYAAGSSALNKIKGEDREYVRGLGALREWSELRLKLEHRISLFRYFAEIIRKGNHNEANLQALEATADTLKKMNVDYKDVKVKTAQEYYKMQEELGAAYMRLSAASEQSNPALLSDPDYMDMKRQLQEMEKQIQEKAAVFVKAIK